MNKHLKLGITLFLIGLAGVLTMLTVSIPTDSLPPQVLEKISPETLRWIVLINPAALLLIAVVLGTVLYEKVGLSVPNISALLNIAPSGIKFSEQLKFGVFYGLVIGILTTLVGVVFKSSIPQELIEVSNKIKVTTIARIGYGGLTEELLMRYGFMTFIVWLIFRMSDKLSPAVYWIGIILSSLLFAIGHFPVVYSAVPNPSLALLTYVLCGNSIAGLFLGWLYWKKGLEAAFIGHIFAHIAMLIGESVFNLQ